MDALSIGAAGMNAAVQRLNSSASRIAGAGASGDLAEPMVDLIRAKHDFQGSAAVVKTADQMMGTLLDMFA